jgi:hypothetical protein
MKVRFRHLEHQPVFWRPMNHALRITLALTDTEHYALTQLGNANDPIYRWEIGDEEFAITPAQCVTGVRLDFDTLFQATEVQDQILRALEKLEVTLQQHTHRSGVETFTIPQEEDQFEIGRNDRPRPKTRRHRRSAVSPWARSIHH